MYKAIIKFDKDYQKNIMLILTERKDVKILKTKNEEYSHPEIVLVVDSYETLNEIVNKLNKETRDGVVILRFKLSLSHLLLKLLHI